MGESTPRGGISFEELTGREMRAIRDVLGRSLSDAARDGDLEVAYALEWIRQRRSDPSVSFESILDLELREVVQHLDGISDEDPTVARSGGS
jgi:hypothetical protein